MSENIVITQSGDADIIQYQPQGVCSKLMKLRVKNEIIEDIEIVGGCSGNLSGISMLVKGLNINEVSMKLSGIPCGARATSCPDQLAQAIKAYKEAKQVLKA